MKDPGISLAPHQNKDEHCSIDGKSQAPSPPPYLQRQDLVSISGRDKDNDVAHEVIQILLFLGASFMNHVEVEIGCRAFLIKTHVSQSIPISCALFDFSVLLASTVSLNLSQLANHGRQADITMVTILSTANIISWDQQRQMFYASSPREVV